MLKSLLTTLVLAACLSSALLADAPDPGVAPAPATVGHQATAAEPAAAPDPDFAAWLMQETTLPAPAFQLAACRTCSQCPPSQPFCCILASGCAACTSRPVVCAPGGLAGA